jgi:hypothetical protein
MPEISRKVEKITVRARMIIMGRLKKVRELGLESN